MGATGSGAGIFAESKGSTLELVSAWLVVTVRNKRVALLFKGKQNSNPFCFASALLLLCFCFASALLLVLELEVPLVLVVEVIF
jgi:hypothetical protein